MVIQLMFPRHTDVVNTQVFLFLISMACLVVFVGFDCKNTFFGCLKFIVSIELLIDDGIAF